MTRALNILIVILVILFVGTLVFLGVKAYQYRQTQKQNNTSPTETAVSDDYGDDESTPFAYDDDTTDLNDGVNNEYDDFADEGNTGDDTNLGEDDVEVVENNNIEDPEASWDDGDVFFVIAGCFLVEQNAINQVDRLQGLGYTEARSVQFINSNYSAVRAVRLSDLDEAKQIARDLQSNNVDAYVLKRRGRNY